MPLIYKLYTAVVALIGSMSLITTGEVNPVFAFVGAGIVWGYFRTVKEYPPLPRSVVSGCALATFAVFLIDAAVSGDVLIAVAQMTLVFQTIKSFDIRDSWDPLQVFFVSLLQLLIASELTRSIVFGVVFLLFLVFIVVSILLSHFVREGQKTFRPFVVPVAALTVAVLAMTAVLFAAMPRFRGGYWGRAVAKSIKTTGFSDTVDFGSFGEVKRDTTVVMRVSVTPEYTGPVYLRGMTFDSFDGVAWHDTIRRAVRIRRGPEGFDLLRRGREATFETEIYLEPIDSDVIFTFGNPSFLRSPGILVYRDSGGSLFMRQKHSRRFFYRLQGTDDFYADGEFLGRYLEFPAPMARMKNLTRDITAGRRDALEQVRRIREYLLRNYRYSLNPGVPDGEASAIDHFLFESKTGYCEHFATAMTLMVRAAGIPARLVTGFFAGRRNIFGDYYIVRQSDAHSWVEAFIEGEWKRFDPTPPVSLPDERGLALLVDVLRLSWDRYIVGFTTADQRAIAGYVVRSWNMPALPRFATGYLPGILLAALALLGAAAFLRRRRPRDRPTGISGAYMKFRRAVARRGGNVTDSSTSAEVLREASRTGTFREEDAKRFIELYRTLRFSGKGEARDIGEYYRTARKLAQ